MGYNPVLHQGPRQGPGIVSSIDGDIHNDMRMDYGPEEDPGDEKRVLIGCSAGPDKCRFLVLHLLEEERSSQLPYGAIGSGAERDPPVVHRSVTFINED